MVFTISTEGVVTVTGEKKASSIKSALTSPGAARIPSTDVTQPVLFDAGQPTPKPSNHRRQTRQGTKQPNYRFYPNITHPRPGFFSRKGNVDDNRNGHWRSFLMVQLLRSITSKELFKNKADLTAQVTKVFLCLTPYFFNKVFRQVEIDPFNILFSLFHMASVQDRRGSKSTLFHTLLSICQVHVKMITLISVKLTLINNTQFLAP